MFCKHFRMDSSAPFSEIDRAGPWGAVGIFLAQSPCLLLGRITTDGVVVAANPCMQTHVESGAGRLWESSLAPECLQVWREAAARLDRPASQQVVTLGFKTSEDRYRCLLERASDGCIWLCAEPLVPVGGRSAAAVMARRLIELDEARIDAESAARTDPLTGLGNRRQEAEWLDTLGGLSSLHDFPLACLVVDIDHFKEVNDRFGHGVGDHVLQAVARALAEAIRAPDRLARHGGDEFVILLPDTDLAGALVLADRLRLRLAGLQVPPLDVGVGASVGVARLEAGELPEALLARADAALLRAKRSGRNRVESA
jgi:diguanylate cyclase (GGDEF)-like protein